MRDVYGGKCIGPDGVAFAVSLYGNELYEAATSRLRFAIRRDARGIGADQRFRARATVVDLAPR